MVSFPSCASDEWRRDLSSSARSPMTTMKLQTKARRRPGTSRVSARRRHRTGPRPGCSSFSGLALSQVAFVIVSEMMAWFSSTFSMISK
jgi:hypothetical protein